MVNLMLLPFRGLVWLIMGCVFSLPWLLILLPVTISSWLPFGLSHGVEKLTGFPCNIEKAEVNLMSGEITLHNVVLSNPDGFYSSDFLKFKKIDMILSWRSLFGSTITLQKLNLDCVHMCSLTQGTVNNLQRLCENLTKKTGERAFKKGCLLEDFCFNFKGLISLRMYMGFVRTKEFLTQKNFTYSNVCLNVPADQKEMLPSTQTQTFENVYNSISTLFNHIGE